MSEIRTLKLELLRHGRSHNHLLSPLTPYLAICGPEGPVTVQFPWEHRQLLNRLERLRYTTEGKEIAEGQRVSEVRDMGEALGLVLGEVPALLGELKQAHGRAQLAHLRLSVSAFELGMVPFEMTIAPDGFPGSGSPLCLQTDLPVCMTREIRRGQPLPVNWNRKPRILFAFATPEGFATVPAQPHLQALRRAIDPWVRRGDTPEENLRNVKEVLTILPDASIEKIRQCCMDKEYTHIHILAHGAPFDHAGDRRYGVALASDTQPGKPNIVDGGSLAGALTSQDSSGQTRPAPTLVSLATCDSGNINSVLTPGGSIAHELHAAGIPWVVASQFPLWMRPSTIAAEVLFANILKGDDPRWVLFTLRQRLRIDSPSTHDWASIVAYATVPWDFAAQVSAFRTDQTRRKNNLRFDRIDVLLGLNERESIPRVPRDTDTEELHQLCKMIRDDHAGWRDEPAAAALGRERAERFGVSGASEKRIAIAYQKAKEEGLSRKAYDASLEFYKIAIDADPTNHWVITQYLAVLAVLSDDAGITQLKSHYYRWWVAAGQLAEWQLRNATGVDRAWALGTLAEITLLGAVYDPSFIEEKATDSIADQCIQLRESLKQNTFPLLSTLRQFKRYIDYWHRNEWNGLASAAVEALSRRPIGGAATSGRT